MKVLVELDIDIDHVRYEMGFTLDASSEEIISEAINSMFEGSYDCCGENVGPLLTGSFTVKEVST